MGTYCVHKNGKFSEKKFVYPSFVIENENILKESISVIYWTLILIKKTSCLHDKYILEMEIASSLIAEHLNVEGSYGSQENSSFK